ncbi:DUF11 domain-containing protein [Candidatus Saccharibacteria bacterium]|nr:DUF11 domain-containing protein [Candidatus Saccharibacteria bacterium]
MKNNTKLKKLGLLAVIFGLNILTTASVSAWGPERATFTMETPATYPTFNSITNNPTIGDERDFVRVGEINADVTSLKNEIEVVPGRQYLVYVYFHNNASATYNDSAHNNSGVALRTKMSTSFSTVLTPAEKGTITATITAENSNPGSVWDEAYMTTKTDKILMHYVTGSAKIYNDWQANGSVMPSSLFTEEGTLVGLNALNGVIPGCEKYHGVVTYVLQAEELGGSIEKTVSKDGEDYKEAVNIAPGEEVYFRLTVRNTGDVALTNAVIKDTLPEGLTLVPGSVGLSANDSTTVDTLSDNIISAGYNLGTIGTGNVVYITYKAKVGLDFDCAGKDLTNTATLVYDSDVSTGDRREDTASVNVKKTDGCDEPDNPPLDTCETNPSMEGCEKPTCETNPEMDGCDKPEPEKTCKTNPEMEGCKELPSTGPLEIVMAVLVVLGIGGGGYYFYRSRKNLGKAEKKAKGQYLDKKPEDTPKPEAPKQV